MSSSTSSNVPGVCIVCGKTPCYTRCSACLANGTDYIFLCSTEHQRLVWFLHKRVCGVNSSPFRVPALSKEEVEEFRTLLDKPFRFGEGNTSTLLSVLETQNKVPPSLKRSGVTEEAYAKATFLGLQEDPKTPLLTQQQLKQLICLRGIAQHARIGTETLTPGELHALIAEHPFDYISMVQGKRNGGPHAQSLPDSRNGEWLDEVLHRHSIFVAIITRIHKKPEARAELIVLLKDFAIRFLAHLARLACSGTEEAYDLPGLLISGTLESCGLISEVLDKTEEKVNE